MTINTYQIKSGLGVQDDISTSSSISKQLIIDSIFNTLLEDNINIADIDKAIGTAADVNSFEFKYKNNSNSVSIPILINTDNGYNLFNSFFQNTYINTTSAYYFYPYSFEDRDYKADEFLTLLLDMKSRSRRMIGSVCNSINITFNEEFVMANSNFIGREIEKEYNSSAESYSIPTEGLFKWGMSDITVGDSYTATDTSVFKNFNLFLKNNLIPKRYNNTKIQKYILGSIGGNGSFIVPFDTSLNQSSLNIYNDSISEDNLVRINIKWGDSSNYVFEIHLLMKIDNTETLRDESQNMVFNYSLVEDRTFTEKINDWSIYNASDNILELDLNTNVILTNNVVPGDLFSVGSNYYNITSIESSTRFKINDASGLSGSESDPMILRHPVNIKLSK